MDFSPISFRTGKCWKRKKKVHFRKLRIKLWLVRLFKSEILSMLVIRAKSFSLPAFWQNQNKCVSTAIITDKPWFARPFKFDIYKSSIFQGIQLQWKHSEWLLFSHLTCINILTQGKVVISSYKKAYYLSISEMLRCKK